MIKKAAVFSALIMSTLSVPMGYAEPAKSDTKPAASDVAQSATADKTVSPLASTQPTLPKPAAAGVSELKRGTDPDVVAVSGKIVETFNAGTYTYFLIEKDGKKTWVAVPPTKGNVGEEISFRPGIQMGEFKSSSLNRTFQNIIFSVGKVGTEETKQGEEFLTKKSHAMQAAPPAQNVPPVAGAKAAAQPDVLSGKVVEILNAGGYTYFSLEKDGKKTWVAVTKTEGKIGETMTFRPGSEMVNFKSKSLDRTFESIIFSDGVASPEISQQDAEALGKKAHENLTQGSTAPSDKNGKPLDVKVVKAGGANGYTVAELYEKSGALNGKEVVVTGKVVKVSKQIMGKNWVHLQDGSGDTATGTNNLVTTTQDIAAVGDVVTATGKLAKDKDFGGGYKYAVIIEETALVKK